MPIDPSIPLGAGRGVQPMRDPLETITTLAELQNRRRYTEAAEAERQQRVLDAEEARAEKQARAAEVEQFGGVLRKHVRPDGTVDWAGVAQEAPAFALPGVAEKAESAHTSLRQREKLDKEMKILTAKTVVEMADALERSMYDPQVWEEAILGLQEFGVLKQDEAEQLLTYKDPASIARAVKAARQAVGTPDGPLVQVDTVEGGVQGKKFIRPVPNQFVPSPPPKPANAPNLQNEEIVAYRPDGTVLYKGQAGYNPDPTVNAYVPVGSTTPFPPGTKVEKLKPPPAPPDPTLAALRDIQLENARAGRSPFEITTFNQIAGAYERSPLVRAADRTLLLQDAVKQVRKDPKHAPNQMALAYGFIQINDTYQSAVREGELRNISVIETRLQQLLNDARRVFDTGSVMSEKLALDIANTSEQMIAAIEEGRKRKLQDFESRAKASGRGVGEMWDQFTAGMAPPASAPKVGAIVTVKGKQVRVTKVNSDGTYTGEEVP